MDQRKQLIDAFNSLCLALADADLNDSEYPIHMVNRLITLASEMRASDVHLQPSSVGLELRLRIDGVLHCCGFIPASSAQRVMARLKVMADLVHYRRDLPQEGRIIFADRDQELRISVLPTLHGEKIVLRFLSGPGHFRSIDELGYPPDVAQKLRDLLQETMGAIVVTGPAGSGKSSCLYACLRDLTSGSNGIQRSIASLEDPIEVAVDGVAQTEVNPSVGLDLTSGLRYLLRQDPEIIMMGEIRDRETADAVLQASLTGHLLLTTFHAGSTAEAISRLLEMDLEPYLIRSSLRAVLSQRLVRRLCFCARPCNDPAETCGLPVEEFYLPTGCEKCAGTGFAGRLALVEFLTLDSSEVARAILAKSDSRTLESKAVEAGMITRLQRGIEAVRSGLTCPSEIRRAFGLLSDERFLPAERHLPTDFATAGVDAGNNHDHDSEPATASLATSSASEETLAEGNGNEVECGAPLSGELSFASEAGGDAVVSDDSSQ